MKINFNKETVTFEMVLPGLFWQINDYVNKVSSSVFIISLWEISKTSIHFIIRKKSR